MLTFDYRILRKLAKFLEDGLKNEIYLNLEETTNGFLIFKKKEAT